MTNKDSWTGFEQEIQIEERAKHAILSNTNLNTILLSATQNITATLAFVQKLSQAKNFQDIVKLQTEFMQAQMNSFNEQSKLLSETYTKAAQDAMKTPFGVRR